MFFAVLCGSIMSTTPWGTPIIYVIFWRQFIQHHYEKLFDGVKGAKKNKNAVEPILLHSVVLSLQRILKVLGPFPPLNLKGNLY